MSSVFITGGTGYIGRPLIEALIKRGYDVRALVRPGSESKVPPGAEAIVGNAFEASSFENAIPVGSTLVHLVGTPHPNPAKTADFRRVDLVSIQAATMSAKGAGVRHFVYISVAHPAPVMQAFVAVRVEGEAMVRASGIPATILRPWYVLGPGHRWPYLLVPLYAMLQWIPATRDTAKRLGLVTRRQMISALLNAVESPPSSGEHIMNVPEIRRAKAVEFAHHDDSTIGLTERT